MADEEQLAILKKGVKAWNEWREKNPAVRPDLMGTNFSAGELYGAHFNGALLSEANLSGANLSQADLHEAHLSGALLRGTRLRNTDLSMADLSGSDFSGAHLRRVDLSGAALSWADLSSAQLVASIFADVDLSLVKGLDKVKHEGPSTIGIDTIYKSKGKIPEVFLRGCGVPDEMIDFIHAITGKAIEFYSCFISYSSKDDDFAKRVHADLQSKGVRVWFAPEDLKTGDKFRSRIDEAIRVYDKLLLVLSEDSIKSPWVEEEVESALEKERTQQRTMLFPVRLDDAVMKTDQAWAASIRRTRHIADMSTWKDHDHYQAAFERLLRDLKASEAK